MKILKYIYHIIINIIKLLIILLIFNYVNYGFETLVIGLLILIYITLEFYIISNGYSEVRKLIGFAEEFIKLRIIFKDPFLINNYDNDDDIYNDILETPKKTLDGITPRFYISMIFSFIYYIICLFQIISVIK
ncbi:hypothetical protein HUU51_04010 [Candidatus Gracilibacteria bacterium]|nr:hypothetical protein [Candidatus Gracilibacteria bacterium]